MRVSFSYKLLHSPDDTEHDLSQSQLSWTHAVNFVSDIRPVVLWSDPLRGLLFPYLCREEKLGGLGPVQTSVQH